MEIGGEVVGVEVKSETDTISRNQERTFDLLESWKIMKVFVWDSSQPEHLISWSEAKKSFRKRKILANTYGGKK